MAKKQKKLAPPIGIPGWMPPSIFAALAIFLFRDFIFSSDMLIGSDTIALGYVVRSLYADALQTLGRIPGWAPHLLGGMPFIEALNAGDSLYPPSLLLLLFTEPHRALGWKLVLHIFLAGLFFFGWVRAIGGSRAAALLGGTAYMLAPFMVGFVHPGHDGKIFVTALAPLLFWATERHFRAPGLASVAGIGLVVASVIYTTHFQMAYFLFGGAGLYAIFRTVQIARGKDEVYEPIRREGTPRSRAASSRLGLFLAASVLGAGGAAYQLLPAVDYVTRYSRRIQTTGDAAGQSGRAWSSSFSMNPEEVMSLVIPEFAGNGAGKSAWATNTYWGRNGLKDNHEYAGLIVLLLAAVSFLGAARKQLRWFFTGLGVTSLGFALGANTPVWGLFYALAPGVRMFRAPGMVVFLFGFGAITMAALGLDYIIQNARSGDEEALSRAQRVLWAGAVGLGALALLATSGVLTTVWTTMVYPSIGERQFQILQAHLPNIVRGASLAALLALATAGVAWGLRQGRIPLRAAVAALILLVVVDEARIDQAFIQTEGVEARFGEDPNIRALQEREQGGEPYRLWSLSRRSQDVGPALYGVELVAGHHPNDLSRYRELIGMVGSGEPANLGAPNVRRLLNVSYILWPDAERGPAPEGLPVVSRTQYGGGRTYQTLLRDPSALPRARLVSSAVVKSDDEAVQYILSSEHDPALEAVLSSAAGVTLDGGPVEGSVTWLRRDADRLELRVESDRPALLIIADNWFPAWHASVNGAETEVLRAYHSLRAVVVPAGGSTVEMWYQSTIVDRSFLLSVLVLLGLVAGGVLGLRSERTTRVVEGAEAL